MAWVQADLTALDDSIADARGAKVIQFADQKYEQHEMPALLNLRALMIREVNTATIQRHRYASTSKGF